MARARLGWLIGWALLAAGSGCRGSGDPIQDLVTELEKAAEAQDAGRIDARLTDDFQGRDGMRRIDVRPALTRYFAAYETVALEVYEVEVERTDGSAHVRFRADFSGRPLQIGALAGFLPPSAMYRFDLTLRQDGKVWRVAAAD